MDAATLKAAGFNDSEIKEYSTLKAAGFSDKEIEDHYAGQATAPVKPEPAQWKKTVANIGDYALPVAGAIGAEVAALPATVASGPFAPATAAVAGTAGYMAGKSGARGLRGILGLEEDKGMVNEAKKSLTEDLPEGLMGSTGGASAIGGLKATGRYVLGKAANSKLPERLWTSAGKAAMGGKLSLKDKRVGTALKEGITPDRKGHEKATGTIESLNAQVDDIVAAAQQQGKTISRDEVLKKLDDLRSFYGKGLPSHQSNIRPIDEAGKSFAEGLPDRIPIQKAQDMKRTTYNIHKKAYNPNVNPGVTTEAEQKIAQGLKEGIEGVAPDVKPINAREGSLIDLLKVVEPSVSRIENSNLLGFGTPMTSAVGGALGGPAGALGAGVAKALSEDPSNKAKLAIYLAKQRGIDLSQIASPASLEQLLMGSK